MIYHTKYLSNKKSHYILAYQESPYTHFITNLRNLEILIMYFMPFQDNADISSAMCKSWDIYHIVQQDAAWDLYLEGNFPENLIYY